jgi:hypothetical protein
MNTKEVTTIIDGYKCEYMGITHDGTTQAYLSKGKYSGSMELALQCGHLDYYDELQNIPQTTLKKIENWAKQVGYFG